MEARSSATPWPRAADGLANCVERGWAALCGGGAGEEGAAVEVAAAAAAVLRLRHGNSEEAAARSRGGRMVAPKGFSRSVQGSQNSDGIAVAFLHSGSVSSEPQHFFTNC